VAKALADSARDTKVLEIRGGVMQGRVITGADVEALAKLPPFDVLRGQVLGAIIAPLNAIAALVNAPLQNLYGLIDARIEQLGGDTEPVSDPSPSEPEAEAETETEPVADTDVSDTNETQEDETNGGS
jgi:hypothetical protein